MYAVIGLGNVGNGYKNTYHNIGFMVVDKLASELNAKFDMVKCKANIAKCEIGDNEVLLVKPTTFMNLSGHAVDEVMRKFKIKRNQLIVVSDDIDLSAGKLRYRASGSGGTHNGLKNIIEVIGSNEFPRLRVGVGQDRSMDLKDYVLSKIEPHKLEVIKPTIDDAVKIIIDKITKGTLLSNDIQIK